MHSPPLAFLQMARSEAQLVQAAHAYLGAWMPATLARLPLPVRASEIRSGDDVSRIAVGIAQLRLDFRLPQDVRDVLDQLYPFFHEASMRLVQIHGAAADREKTPDALRRLFG